jgi:hypothetical protein
MSGSVIEDPQKAYHIQLYSGIWRGPGVCFAADWRLYMCVTGNCILSAAVQVDITLGRRDSSHISLGIRMYNTENYRHYALFSGALWNIRVQSFSQVKMEGKDGSIIYSCIFWIEITIIYWYSSLATQHRYEVWILFMQLKDWNRGDKSAILHSVRHIIVTSTL